MITLQDLSLIAIGAFTVDENNNPQYYDSIMNNHEERENQVYNSVNFLI